MGPWILILAHVLLFAAVPVAITARRGPLTTPLLYAYLAVVLMLGGFLSGIYQFPMTDDITIGGGSVAYGGLMFTALILLVTTRDLAAHLQLAGAAGEAVADPALEDRIGIGKCALRQVKRVAVGDAVEEMIEAVLAGR